MMSFFRSPFRWVPVALLLVLATTWFMSPRLRLAIRGVAPDTVSSTKIVSAHQYDNDWFDAARAGRVDILGALLDAGYPVDATTSAGYTAVILAAYNGQPPAVDYLLSRHAKACMGDRNGNTALMGALYKGELPIARRLLDTACPIDQQNNAGETALSFAVMFGRLDFIRSLIERGADPEHRDAQGQTPHQVAEKQRNAGAMQVIEKETLALRDRR